MLGVSYPYAVISTRIALERGAWREASNLPLYARYTLFMEEISAD